MPVQFFFFNICLFVAKDLLMTHRTEQSSVGGLSSFFFLSFCQEFSCSFVFFGSVHISVCQAESADMLWGNKTVSLFQVNLVEAFPSQFLEIRIFSVDKILPPADVA